MVKNLRFRFLKASKGQALIQALMLTMAVGGISSVIFSKMTESGKSTRAPRIKSQMLQLETKFRAGLLQMSNYQNCPNNGPYGNCQLQASYYSSFDTKVRGCLSAQGGGVCGITISAGTTARPAPGIVYNAATNMLDIYATVKYTGTEVNVARREILASVPLTSASSNIAVTGTCPANSPVFQGFSATGVPICATVSPTCGPGEYLKEITQGQGTRPATGCTSYAQNITCPGSRYIASYSWNGGSNYSTTCQDPVSPFAYYGFNPNLVVGAPVSVAAAVTTSTTTTTVAATTTSGPSCLWVSGPYNNGNEGSGNMCGCPSGGPSVGCSYTDENTSGSYVMTNGQWGPLGACTPATVGANAHAYSCNPSGTTTWANQDWSCVCSGTTTTTAAAAVTTTTTNSMVCLTSNMGPVCMEGTGVPYPSTCGAVGISPSSYPDCPINALMPYMPDPTAGMVDLSASNGRCRVPAYTSAGGSIDVCGGGCGTGFSGSTINIPSGTSVETVYQCGVSSGVTPATTTTTTTLSGGGVTCAPYACMWGGASGSSCNAGDTPSYEGGGCWCTPGCSGGVGGPTTTTTMSGSTVPSGTHLVYTETCSNMIIILSTVNHCVGSTNTGLASPNNTCGHAPLFAQDPFNPANVSCKTSIASPTSVLSFSSCTQTSGIPLSSQIPGTLYPGVMSWDCIVQ